jgi:heme exporter protein C
MLWGKPMWGTWWVWDARLTSVLILFFLYLGYIVLWSAIDEPTRAARAARILALVGAINIPIIKFSVDWWNTLHQSASVLRTDGPAMPPSMLTPLLVMGLAYALLYVALLFVRMRTEISQRRLRTIRMGLEAEPA